ncbi:MAG: YceI family protein [Actinomycetota bacterium]
MRSTKKIAGAVVLLGLAGAGLVYASVLSEAPAELEVNAAASTESASVIADPGGRWMVQPGSVVGYRVRRTFAGTPAAGEVVGSTNAIQGGLLVTPEGQNYAVSDILIVVDVSKLASDSPTWDDAMRTGGLETERFPSASFEADGPVVIPARVAGELSSELSFEGRLTIRDETRHVSIPVQSRVKESGVEVEGEFTFLMSEFGIAPTGIPGVLTIEPTATLEFKLLLAKAA